MEFQRAWEMTGFDAANSGAADDSGPTGTDASGTGEADDAAAVDGPDAAADFDDTAEMSEVVVADAAPVAAAVADAARGTGAVADAAPGTGAVADALPGVASADVGAARPGALAAVRRALRGTNAALVGSGLVVCLVAILVVTAWHSSGSRTSAATGADRAPEPPIAPNTMDASGRSKDAASGAPAQRRSASPSGSATEAAASTGTTGPGQSNAAPAPRGQSTAPRAPRGKSDTEPAQREQDTEPQAQQEQQPQQIATVHITGLAGKCLGAAGGGTGNGTAVDLYSCNGAATQQWGMFSDGTLRTAGKCMEVAGGGTADGTSVQLYECNGSAAQRWTHTAGNDLVNPRADKCLDLKERSSADFTVTQIWSCNGGSNQKWTLS